MCSPGPLRQWIAALLPEGRAGSGCSRAAAGELLRALLVGYHTQLGQLARQADRSTTARGTRQFFARWLNRDHRDPVTIYTHLHRLTRRLLARQKEVLLLIDTTDLSDGWVVLHVATPWQQRALPLFQVVYPYAGPERDQVQALATALAWLQQHLPGPRRRYVLVMDRGFPSNPLVTQLPAQGWRFVLRVKSNWRMEHPRYTGQMRHAMAQGLVGPDPFCFRAARLGCGTKGRARRSQAQGCSSTAWATRSRGFSVTSPMTAAAAVAYYRQRMRIEEEFRDLKGPLALDQLAAWLDRDRVARFLAWIAVYEWRLAFLWE